MAFQKAQNRKRNFDGFFSYEDGNVIQGTVECVVITGKTDDGNEKGFVGIKVELPCQACQNDEDFDAHEGQVIAVSITSGTRVLIGTEGKRVRCTFNGFKETKRGKYHDWDIEIDDGQ